MIIENSIESKIVELQKKKELMIGAVRCDLCLSSSPLFWLTFPLSCPFRRSVMTTKHWAGSLLPTSVFCSPFETDYSRSGSASFTSHSAISGVPAERQGRTFTNLHEHERPRSIRLTSAQLGLR